MWIKEVTKEVMYLRFFYFQVNNLHHYHVDVFKDVIDMQLQERNHRFDAANTKLLLCIACLCPHESFEAFDLD